MRTTRILLVFILLIALSPDALAVQKTFIRDYTYEATELDDKTSCQSIALEQVKRLLLEEMGTYVESSTTVKDYQLEHDKVTTLTAGIVRTKILQESWDGKTYWLKARLSADSDEVAKAIAQLMDNQQTVKDLEEARREAFDAMAEVERLKSVLAKAETSPEQKSRYDQSIQQLQATDLLEEGQSYIVAGKYEDALDTYNQFIAVKPSDAKGYSNIAIAYLYLGNYRQAVMNFNQAAKIEPGNPYLVKNRNIAYKMLKTPQQVTLQERNSLLPMQGIAQSAYRSSSQTAILPYQRSDNMRQERARLMQQSQQRGQGNFRPGVRQDRRQEVMNRQQAQANRKKPTSARQAKAGNNKNAKRKANVQENK